MVGASFLRLDIFFAFTPAFDTSNVYYYWRDIIKIFFKSPPHYDVLVSVTIKEDSFDISLNVEIGSVNNGN